MAKEPVKEVKDIRTDVAEQLAKIAPRVIDIVASTLVNAGLTKRADGVTKCLAQLDKLEADKKKIDRPDQIFFNRDRSEKSENFSDARLKELEKIDQQIMKITKAVNKAIENGDYQDVYNLAGGGNKGGSDSKDGGNDPAADS